MTTVAIGTRDSVEQAVVSIPALTHDEARQLAQTEHARVLAVLEQLTEADWARPTYCTQWTVREMVAHLAGSCAGSASWGEFWRQLVANPYTKREAEMVDGINRRQVEDRRSQTPAQLIEEFRQAGAKAVRVRHGLPWLVRQIPVPMGAVMGLQPLHYLMDTIYPRDQWMHRVDLCEACGVPFVATAEHDGRLVALAVRELAGNLVRAGHAFDVDLELTGVAGGRYHFGGEARCRIVIDTLVFSLLASERIEPGAALGQAMIDGDREHAAAFLDAAKVLY